MKTNDGGDDPKPVENETPLQESLPGRPGLGQGPIITVAAAIIEHKHRFLLLKRAPHKENGGMWEFPGGKLDEGENLQQCVVRELAEELDVKAEATELLGSCEAQAGERRIHLFGIKTVIDHEPVKMKDHTEFKWVSYEELPEYPMTHAELALIHHLRHVLPQEWEVTHMNVWSAAKIYGSAYSIVGVFMGMFLFMSVKAFPVQISFFQRLGLSVFFPVLNFIIGAALGAIICVIYNVLAAWVGGMRMRLR